MHLAHLVQKKWVRVDVQTAFFVETQEEAGKCYGKQLQRGMKQQKMANHVV